jgi:hypothetical protein
MVKDITEKTHNFIKNNKIYLILGKITLTSPEVFLNNTNTPSSFQLNTNLP